VRSNLKNKYCITSENLIQYAINTSNKKRGDFQIGKFGIIVFSNYLLEYFKDKLNLNTNDWLAPFHPYSSGQIHNGIYEDFSISIIMPSMGASPIASIAEDMINCGAKSLFLVCGAWGIANNVKLLDFLVPTHAIGPDGTSIYYGRDLNEETIINKLVADKIINETKKRTKNYHVGKNYSIEAFYKIKIEKVKELQKKNVISMENGELNTLTTICNQRNVRFGAIFYNYFNPLKPWKVPWFEEEYKKCVELEGKIILAVIKSLAEEIE
jgi:uridine phosphorylase